MVPGFQHLSAQVSSATDVKDDHCLTSGHGHGGRGRWQVGSRTVGVEMSSFMARGWSTDCHCKSFKKTNKLEFGDLPNQRSQKQIKLVGTKSGIENWR